MCVLAASQFAAAAAAAASAAVNAPATWLLQALPCWLRGQGQLPWRNNQVHTMPT
jgi:hypothetical protein